MNAFHVALLILSFLLAAGAAFIALLIHRFRVDAFRSLVTGCRCWRPGWPYSSLT